MKSVVISKVCSAKGCRKIAVQAKRMSNRMWLSQCPRHVEHAFTIDFEKVGND